MLRLGFRRRLVKDAKITLMRKGDMKVVRIESIAVGGEGVSKDFEIPIFINRVAPGDLAEVEVFDVRKSFARARLDKLVEPSPERTDPPCPVFKVCGGCQLQHIAYPFQLKAKQQIVQQALKHIGGIDPDLVGEPIGAANDLHYRNKVQFPVRHPSGSDRMLAGYYKQDSHELVNIKFCPIQPQSLDSMLAIAKELLQEQGIRAYDEKTHAGTLRHITARHSFALDKILVTFVVNIACESYFSDAREPMRRRLETIATGLMEQLPSVIGVCLNFNTTPGNKIMGDETTCLAGVDHLEEILKSDRLDLPQRLRDGITYSLSPTSFFQVNTAQAVRLFEVIYDAVKPDTNNSPALIVDAYAGVGAMSLWLSAACHQVIAVEDHAPAVEDGLRNVQLNGITNVSFRCGGVETVLLEMHKEGLVPDVVVLDPPRKGLSEEAVAAVLKLAPAKIVYVSCNPATLARDLKIFQRGALQADDQEVHKDRVVGYKTIMVRPVDLFPHTHHIESVTVLERL
jgi:23S rRNA (uracil1939-C5)-methyltransferase